MEDKKRMEERILAVAKELATMHGVFFAARFLADQSVRLELALLALTAQKPHVVKSACIKPSSASPNREIIRNL